MLAIQAMVPASLLVVTQRAIAVSSLLILTFTYLRRSRMPGEPRNAWGWFALAFLVHVFIVLTGPLFPGNKAFLPTAAMVYMACMAMGITGWFDEGALWAGGVRRMLDGLVFALALIALAWNALHGSAGMHHGTTWFRILTNIVTWALLLGIVIFEVQVDLKRLKGPLGWLSLTLVGAIINNLVSMRAQLNGVWSPSHLGAVTSSLNLIGFYLAAFAPWSRDALTREEGRGQSHWGGVLAYFPFGLTLIWMLISLRPGVPPDPALMMLVGVMAGVMLVRQLIALRDQAGFYGVLKARLAERTQALEEYQAIIMRTQRMNLVATLGAGLAHDFNNMLGAMVSLSEQGRNQEATETARKAAGLARRMMNLASHEPRPVQLFELQEMLEDRHRLLDRIAGATIRVELNLGLEECWMEADPLEIEQILVNLVSNARDAIAGEGVIQLRLSKQGGQAILEVEDTGTGMDEVMKARLFQPFFTTKGEGRGTGLGLASVKATVDQLGGRVEVESQVGVGTTFTLFLPVVEVD